MLEGIFKKKSASSLIEESLNTATEMFSEGLSRMEVIEECIKQERSNVADQMRELTLEDERLVRIGNSVKKLMDQYRKFVV